MPLMHGKSEKAFTHNVRTEMHEGKPQKQSLAIAYAMKKKAKKAMGGEACGDEMAKMATGGEITQEHREDIVDRILRKHMSKGGEVANDTEDTADFEDNQFDDLVKDDDLEFHETGANEGDEIGDEQEDEDRHDIVGRIMKSRAKKDRLPRPA